MGNNIFLYMSIMDKIGNLLCQVFKESSDAYLIHQQLRECHCLSLLAVSHTDTGALIEYRVISSVLFRVSAKLLGLYIG